MKTTTTDLQVRAARELLRWDQKKLAVEASLSLATIRRYELGHGVSDEVIAKIVASLEKAGLLFIGETDLNGVKISAAIALRQWAKPEARPPTREYSYKPGTTPGRPSSASKKSRAAHHVTRQPGPIKR